MVSVDFEVFKGSKNGDIILSKGHRELGPSEALIEITHSGVCGSDEHFRHIDRGLGHEGIGVIKSLGSNAARISDLQVGDRVGMGWTQFCCFHCEECLTGHHYNCKSTQQFMFSNLDQGCFGSAVTWDVSTLIKIPDEIASEHAAPLMCAGQTVWGPLFEQGFRAGDRVGVVGVGGLGHLAIHFASKMGFDVVVFSGTDSKRAEAIKFGALEFYATKGVAKFEGVKPINHLLITTSVMPDIALYMDVMAHRGKIFPLTVGMDATPIPILPMIGKTLSIIGSAGAHIQSIMAMMRFCVRHNIRPQVEKFPMSQSGITEAMHKLNEGKVRYRAVVEVI